MGKLSNKKLYYIKIDSRALLFLTVFLSISILNTWLDRLERCLYGVEPGVTLQGEKMEGLLPDEVRLVVEELAKKYQKMPVEPGIDKKTGQFIKEESGCLVDVGANVEEVLAAEQDQKISLQVIVIRPQYTVNDLQAANQTLGYYETWLRGTYQRYNNISLAATGINNTIIWPQETFSFNDTVGPRTAERGYLPAPVFLMGGTGLDYGGGVCQVSSTLYNAARKAGMKIVERHPHSKPVAYVPLNADATVNYDSLDLKFTNVYRAPIVIRAGVDHGKVWVSLKGREDNNAGILFQ